MENDNKQNKKPVIYYIALVSLIILLLNAFVFPLFSGHRVTEVGYSTFLNMVDEGKVKEVVLDDNYILFTAEAENGKVATYQTGVFPDNGLIERLENAGVEFSSYIESEGSPFITFLISWIAPILMFTIIGRILFTALNKRGGNAMSFGSSNAKIYAEKETGVTFKDVQGEDEAKEALEEIVSYLHDNDKYAKIGAKLPKGVLLVGPPGTGKTLLAKAVAGEAKVPFFSISGSEFVEMFVGMGASKVRDLFKQASEKAPCIVFIDEIDTIGKKREGNGAIGGNDEREQTLNQLLTEMDGFDANKGVVILGATNRPEILDPALLRPGRFDRRIPVNLPDIQGRIAILKVHAKDVKMEDNIDFNAIARATSGASGAELANIINEAALRAVRQGRECVTQEDLEESVETVIAGYKRKNAVLSEEEKKIVAFHEIGHALVAAKQTNSAPVTKITIVPRTSGSLGYTMQVEEGEKNLMSKEDILTQIATLTGGREAEKLIFRTITTGASNDIERATKLARSMITQYGMSDQFGMVALETVNNQYLGGDTSLICSPATSEAIDKEVVKIIKEAEEKAYNILQENKEKLNELSAFLLEKETITGDEFMSILSK